MLSPSPEEPQVYYKASQWKAALKRTVPSLFFPPLFAVDLDHAELFSWEKEQGWCKQKQKPSAGNRYIMTKRDFISFEQDWIVLMRLSGHFQASFLKLMLCSS